MPAMASLLEKFRHSVGTPGAPAAGGGVPLDLAHDLELELRPLFDELDQVEREAAALGQAATAEAGQIRDSGAAEAHRALAAAVAEQPRARASAASSVGDRAQSEIAEILARAEADAKGVGARAKASRERFVAMVVTCVTGSVGPTSAKENRHVAGVDRR